MLTIALGAAVAASGAVVWLRANANDDVGPTPAVLYAYGDSFVLTDGDDDGGERRRLAWTEAGDDATAIAAGTGRVLVSGDAATLWASIEDEGDEARRVGDGGLTPMGPWSQLRPDRVEGVVLGTGLDAEILVDLETGEWRSLGAVLPEAAEEPALVTSYATDGQRATMLVEAEHWLVPVTTDAIGAGEPRPLDARWAGFSGAGDRLAVLRGEPAGDQRLVLVPTRGRTDGGNERTLWTGSGITTAAWAGDSVSLFGAGGVTLVDMADGHAVDTVAVPNLDPSTAPMTRATLVATGDPEPRWFRLDETGAEVTELRGLAPLPVPRLGGGRIAFGGVGGDGDRIIAWNLRDREAEALAGTGEQLAHLESVDAAVTQSPEGRYVAAGRAPVVLGDFKNERIVTLDGFAGVGAFRPDGRRLIVGRADDRIAVVDPEEPATSLWELPAGARAPTWVYP